MISPAKLEAMTASLTKQTPITTQYPALKSCPFGMNSNKSDKFVTIPMNSSKPITDMVMELLLYRLDTSFILFLSNSEERIGPITFCMFRLGISTMTAIKKQVLK